MKKIISVFIILGILSFLTGCSSFGNDTNAESEIDYSKFNFKFKYGVNAKNAIDTFNNTYTKDLVLDGTTTIDFTLTDEEKKSIVDNMFELDVFNYPTEFKKYFDVTPMSTFILELEYKGERKTLSWTSENIPHKKINATKYVKNDETKHIIGLVKLSEKIKDIIHNKSEYKELPESQGGYL